MIEGYNLCCAGNMSQDTYVSSAEQSARTHKAKAKARALPAPPPLARAGTALAE